MIEALERRARHMTEARIHAFGPAVERAGQLQTWRSDEPFWFLGTGSLEDLTSGEEEDLELLWERMLVGLAYAATGEDVDAPPPPAPAGSGIWKRFARWDRAHSSKEGRATALLERHVGGKVWSGVVGIWNAFAATLLGDRLEPQLRHDLMAPWRLAMGSIQPAAPEPAAEPPGEAGGRRGGAPG